MTHRPRRSVLYMPGTNERALEKARTIDADALILDLEDSVAPEAKAEARSRIAAALKTGGYGRRELVVRINGLDTPWGMDDLDMALQARPHAVLVPKISSPRDVQRAAQLLPEGLVLWAMMETPLAILNAHHIAAGGGPLSCLVMGTNDLLKETRATAANARMALLPALTTCVLAARAHGLEVIDGVFNDFKDEAGLRAECQQGRDLGMDGKTLIHPGQVAVCNETFSAAQDEIARARKIIAAFALPENTAKGVITIDGKMVERLHLAMAQRLVQIAETISP